MANIKISELTALTPPDAADLVPVVDTTPPSSTKRTTVGELVIAGAKELARGTEAAPAVAFGGATDANTGIYSPGADQLALSTSGTGRLFVDASGNVGIGVSPSASLEVNGEARFTRSGVASQYVGIIGDGTDTRIVAEGSSKNLTIKNNSTTSSAIIFDQAVASSYIFNQAGTERLRITSTGELKHLGGGTEGSPAVYFAGSAPSNSLYVEATTGHVGIGTNSPARTLDVRGSAVFNDGTVQATIWPQVATNVAGFGTNNNYPVALVTNGSQRLHVTATGSVGIGTTNVDELLHVESGGATPKIKVESTLADSSPGFRVTNDARSYDIRIDGTNDNLQLYDATASEGRVAIDSSGRLLVGTPSARTNFVSSVFSGTQQIEAASNSSNIGLSITNGSSLGYTAVLALNSHKTNSIGGTGATTNGFTQGQIQFNGSDGTNFIRGAVIDGVADGDWASGDCPGRLVFSSNPGAPATGPAEAMRINSAQELLIGYTSDNGAYKLQVNSQIFATSATIATSDGRYKENVAALDGCVDLVKALRPVSFDWKAQEPVTRVDEDGETVVVREAHNFPEGKQVGFIAQEVEEVLADKPWLGSVIKQNIRPAVTDPDGNELAPEEEFLGIAESNLIAVLTSALQEAIGRIETLEAKVAALEGA